MYVCRRDGRTRATCEAPSSGAAMGQLPLSRIARPPARRAVSRADMDSRSIVRTHIRAPATPCVMDRWAVVRGRSRRVVRNAAFPGPGRCVSGGGILGDGILGARGWAEDCPFLREQQVHPPSPPQCPNPPDAPASPFLPHPAPGVGFVRGGWGQLRWAGPGRARRSPLRRAAPLRKASGKEEEKKQYAE